MRALGSALVIAALAATAPRTAHATYNAIDIGSYVNSVVDGGLTLMPTGYGLGNQGTGIPFLIATYGVNGYAGKWIAAGRSSPGAAPSLTVNLAPLNISGQYSFYALLNNYYGTAGANEYSVTIRATNNDAVTYSSIGGVDTRDFNANPATTATIAGSTTPWYDNGVGQRADVRRFDLPASFAAETLASFTIDQLQYNDPALLFGLTFSSEPAAFGVPEPATLGVLGLGLAGLTASRRARRAASPARGEWIAGDTAGTAVA